MDPSIRTKATLVNDNQSWIGNGGKPAMAPRSIVLDRSAFNLAAAPLDKGFFPSGIVVGRITATGLYGPYTDAGAGGLDTAAGLIFAAVPYDRDSTGDLAAALFFAGEVIVANLPTGHGLTTAARADLAAHIAFVG